MLIKHEAMAGPPLPARRGAMPPERGDQRRPAGGADASRPDRTRGSRTMKRLLLTIALAVALAPAARAEYPEKPIEMIVAFAAGGGTDVAARSIASFMEKHLG